MAITIKDVKVEDSSFELSLVKLVGKQVKDVRGYISYEFGSPTFKLTSIVFEDDSEVGVEGEHDFPYITTYPAQPQPNLDEETLERLYDEGDE